MYMMLKKTMMAIGIAAVAASGANAASTLAVSGASSTKTGLTIGGALIPGSDVIDMRADGFNALVYTVQGTSTDAAAFANSLKHIDIELTNGSISPASSITAEWGGVSMSNASTTTITYPTANTIRLVTAVSTGALESIVSGSTLTVAGLKVLPQTIETSGTVTAGVKAVSTVADSTIDSASAVLATYINEFTASVASAFNGVIDVAKDQTGYADGQIDAAQMKLQNIQAQKFDVDSATGTFTFSGDFAFLDTDGDGKLEAKEGALGTSSSMTLSTPAASLDVVSGSIATVANGVSTATLTVTASSEADAKVIPVQTFTGAVTASYTRDGKTVVVPVASDLTLGAWTLNAASRTVDMLPFGSAYAHSITVTNPSKLDADISVTLVGNGTSVTETLGVAAKAQSATEIGPLVAAIANSKGMDKASVTVVVDAKDVVVKGLFYSKADGDRVLMTTTANN
jgi:hypothetical protein